MVHIATRLPFHVSTVLRREKTPKNKRKKYHVHLARTTHRILGGRRQFSPILGCVVFAHFLYNAQSNSLYLADSTKKNVHQLSHQSNHQRISPDPVNDSIFDVLTFVHPCIRLSVDHLASPPLTQRAAFTHHESPRHAHREWKGYSSSSSSSLSE